MKNHHKIQRGSSQWRRNYSLGKKIKTWKLVSRQGDIKSISCKWVYKIKCLLDESIERYKAQLVARGFSQQYGLGYDETFSPVAKISIVRIPLALVVCKDWKLW